MCLNKVKGRPPFGEAISLIEKWILYLFVLLTPLLFYPLEIDGIIFNLRKIREIALYSFAIVICTFLQKSRWLRYLIIWCMVNWWLNYFWPKETYVGLTNILSALILYIGIKHFLEIGCLKVDLILKTVCIVAIFQFLWMIMQCFNYDPIFYPITTTGAKASVRMPLAGWSGNPSVLGVFFACTSFLLLHYFKIKKVPILFFVILSSIFFVKNATTAICFATGGLFYLLNRYRFKMKYILCCILIIVMLGSFFIYVKQPNFDRLAIWKEILDLGIRVRPFVGRGINFFSHLYIVDKTGTPWREAHNDYLQLILELGIIGFVLFMGFIMSRFKMFFEKTRSTKQIALAACLVAYLTAGISLFPMHLAQLSFYAIVLLCCLEKTYDAECQYLKF